MCGTVPSEQGFITLMIKWNVLYVAIELHGAEQFSSDGIIAWCCYMNTHILSFSIMWKAVRFAIRMRMMIAVVVWCSVCNCWSVYVGRHLWLRTEDCKLYNLFFFFFCSYYNNNNYWAIATNSATTVYTLSPAAVAARSHHFQLCSTTPWTLIRSVIAILSTIYYQPKLTIQLASQVSFLSRSTFTTTH